MSSEENEYMTGDGEEDNRPLTTHPFQPLVMDEHNVMRFKKNAIVRELLDRDPGIPNTIGPTASGLNRIAHAVDRGDHTAEDYSQLMQLIGYSVSGYGDLTIVPVADRRVADDLATVFRAALDSRLKKNTRAVESVKNMISGVL